MDFEVDTSGLDELINKLDEIGGKNEVSFGELFPDPFIKTYTDFETLEDLFEESGYEVESAEDFDQIPQEDWDNFIESHTEFSSWQDMMGKAFQRWVGEQLEIN